MFYKKKNKNPPGINLDYLDQGFTKKWRKTVISEHSLPDPRQPDNLFNTNTSKKPTRTLRALIAYSRNIVLYLYPIQHTMEKIPTDKIVNWLVEYIFVYYQRKHSASLTWR